MSKRARDMAVRHLNKGVSLIEKGDYEDALQELSEAEIHSKESDAPEILASVMQTYGDLLFTLGRENEALERYYHALEAINESSGPSYIDKGELAGMLSNMAFVLETNGEKEEAKEKYESSVAIYEELIERENTGKKYLENTASTLNNLAALLAEMGEYERSNVAFDKALRIMDEIEDDEKSNSLLARKAMILENVLNSRAWETDQTRSEDMYEKLIGAYRTMIGIDPAERYYKYRLVKALGAYAEMFLEKDVEKAREVLEEVIHTLDILSDEENASLGYEMVSSLRNYAICLGKTGDLAAAKDAITKAAHIIAELLKADNRDQGNITMAESVLEDLIRLSDMEEDSNRKISDLEEFVKLSKTLVGIDPDNVSYQIRMAFSLNVRGQILAEMGKWDEAGEDIVEAIGMAFDAFEKDPSNPSYQSAVRSMITDLELIGKEDAGKEWALKLNQLLLRELEKNKNTGTDTDNLEIANILEENGNILAQKGQYDDALKAFLSAKEAFERIHNANKRSPEYMSRVRNILFRIGDLQSKNEQPYGLFRTHMELFRMDPEEKEQRARLEELLDRIVIDIADTDKGDDLLRKYSEIADAYGELIEAEPENHYYPLKLLNLKEQMAGILLEDKRYEVALDTYFELLEADRSNAFYRSKTIRTLDMYRSDTAAKEDINERVEGYGLLLSKYDRFMEMEPANASVLISKAEVLRDMGDLMEKAGHMEKAASNYQLAARAYGDLLGLEPANSDHLNDLALTKAHLGSLLIDMGNNIDAKQEFEEALRIHEELESEDGCDISCLQSIAHILGNIGYILLDMGQIEEAKPVYERALKTYASLMDLEPENKFHLENAAATMNNLGYILECLGRKGDADWMYEKARDLSGN